MNRTSCAVLVVCCLAVSQPLFASGWDNSLIGARAGGMGSAFAGLADDATAIFYNPGGLAFTGDKGEIILVGKQYWPEHSYTTFEGDETVTRTPTFLPELFAYTRLGERFTLGLGIYNAYAGGGIEWLAEDVGIHVDGSIYVTSITPTASFQVNDWMALGLNLNYYMGKSDQSYEDPNAGYTDVSRFSSDEDDTSLAVSGAVFVKPSDRWSLGLTWHGPSDMNLTGSTDLETPVFSGTFDSSTSFSLPWWTALGGAYHISEKWKLVAEWDYFNWSSMEALDKTISDTPFGDIEQQEITGFDDASYFQFGTEYDISENWTIRGGASYEERAVQAAYLSLTNVDASKYHIFGGVTYNHRKWHFDLGGFWSTGKEVSTPRDSEQMGYFDLPGTYNIDAAGLLFSIGRTF